jgi:hypothetical protein
MYDENRKNRIEITGLLTDYCELYGYSFNHILRTLERKYTQYPSPIEDQIDNHKFMELLLKLTPHDFNKTKLNQINITGYPYYVIPTS